MSTFGIKGSYPNNLKIRKVARTQNLSASWLPSVEEDHRPNSGRVGKSGKRDPIRESMGTADPYEAATRAVVWVQELQRAARAIKEKQESQQEHSLETYWLRWYEREIKSRKSQRNFKRWLRDTRLKWEGESYGLKHQSWAKKSVDKITAADLNDYMALLDSRRTETNDMAGTKLQQKTLIRELLKEARQSDFQYLSIPDFPVITRQDKQVRHLMRDEWDLLLATITDLSKGAARQDITLQQYKSLEWRSDRRDNQRNWVDLYDALNLMWFFFLRAEDLPRLKAEWFREKNDDITCNLEFTKGNRDKRTTTHYRRDAVSNWRRMSLRRPKGHLVLPHIPREQEDTSETLMKTLNHLLRIALDQCKPPIPSKGMTMTNIRHTAFRLTLEEMPELGHGSDLAAFAENGMTSVKMLYKTYIKYIDQEKTARKAREKIPAGDWSMVKRVSWEDANDL